MVFEKLVFEKLIFEAAQPPNLKHRPPKPKIQKTDFTRPEGYCKVCGVGFVVLGFRFRPQLLPTALHFPYRSVAPAALNPRNQQPRGKNPSTATAKSPRHAHMDILLVSGVPPAQGPPLQGTRGDSFLQRFPPKYLSSLLFSFSKPISFSPFFSQTHQGSQTD